MWKFLFGFLLLTVIGCNDLKRYRDRQVECSYDNFKDFKNDEGQEQKLLECIRQFRESDFRGVIIVRDDSLIYGWHEGYLKNPNIVLESLKKYEIYSVNHLNGTSYFKKGAGFIDDSCGLMYVPEGIKIPIGVKNSEFLVESSGAKGAWYYVEAKL